MNKLVIAISLALATAGAFAADAGFMPWTDVMGMYLKKYPAGITMDAAKDHDLGQQFPGFQPFFQDHFADLDTNKDGVVTQDETTAMMHKMNWSDKDMVNQFYKNTGFMATNPANK